MDLTTECLESLFLRTQWLTTEYEQFRKVRLLPDPCGKKGRYEITEYSEFVEGLLGIVNKVALGVKPSDEDVANAISSRPPVEDVVTLFPVRKLTSSEQVTFAANVTRLFPGKSTIAKILLMAAGLGAWYTFTTPTYNEAIIKPFKTYLEQLFSLASISMLSQVNFTRAPVPAMTTYQYDVANSHYPYSQNEMLKTHQDLNAFNNVTGVIQQNLRRASALDKLVQGYDVQNRLTLQKMIENLTDVAKRVDTTPTALFMYKFVSIVSQADDALNPQFKDNVKTDLNVSETIKTLYNVTDVAATTVSDQDAVCNRLTFQAFLKNILNSDQIEGLLGQASSSISKILESESKFLEEEALHDSNVYFDRAKTRKFSRDLHSALHSAHSALSQLSTLSLYKIWRKSLGEPLVSMSNWAQDATEGITSTEVLGYVLESAMTRFRDTELWNDETKLMAEYSKRLQSIDISHLITIFSLQMIEIVFQKVDNEILLPVPLKNQMKAYTVQIVRFAHRINQDALFDLTQIPTNIPEQANEILQIPVTPEDDQYILNFDLTFADKDLVHRFMGEIGLYNFTVCDPDEFSRVTNAFHSLATYHVLGGVVAAWQAANDEAKLQAEQFLRQQRRSVSGISATEWKNGRIEHETRQVLSKVEDFAHFPINVMKIAALHGTTNETIPP